jgi:hypothetical protein
MHLGFKHAGVPKISVELFGLIGPSLPPIIIILILNTSPSQNPSAENMATPSFPPKKSSLKAQLTYLEHLLEDMPALVLSAHLQF